MPFFKQRHLRVISENNLEELLYYLVKIVVKTGGAWQCIVVIYIVYIWCGSFCSSSWCHWLAKVCYGTGTLWLSLLII